MIVRPIEECDLNAIKVIHETFYKDEFSLPDFTEHFLATFLVTTDDNKIVTAGGIKTIVEAVTMTDKSFSNRIKREALLQYLQGSLYFSQKNGYNELHTYVQGENWVRILNKVGFQPTRGQSLVALW